jgi:16S rRNA (cytosine967-C5)-methyltransferase
MKKSPRARSPENLFVGLRRDAILLLSNILDRKIFVDAALERLRTTSGASAQHQKLIEFWIKGVLEHKEVLAKELGSLNKSGSRPLELPVEATLLLGLFQLRYQDNAHAAGVVSESVDVCRALKLGRASGFVNAVLRNALRQNSQKSAPASTQSFPDWLVQRLELQYKVEAKEILAAMSKAPPLTFRVNTQKTTRQNLQSILEAEGVCSSPSLISPNCVHVDSLPPSLRLPDLTAFKEGLFFIQDESSAIVSELVAVSENESVLDLCSAPGGKACSLALLMRDNGQVSACDISEKRLQKVRQNISRLNLRCISLAVADAAWPPFDAKFDKVLLDAPCSGLGTLARKADIRWNREASQFSELSRLQLKLLKGAYALLNEQGGQSSRLVYSTCSIDQEENEQVIEAFLSSTPNATLVTLPAWLPQHLKSKCGRFLLALPHRARMTGAFGAVIKRA